jgi:competence protein ComEA
MNARPLPIPERGLILLIGAGLLVSGVLLYVTRDGPAIPSTNQPIVLENVLVIQPTFYDTRTIDPNTASVEDLIRLPGIGEVLAGRIVSYRDEHGPFTSVDDLLAVSGIGPKLLEGIREHVTVGPEEGEAPSGGQ